jgi:hypothetical protein
MSRPEVTMTEPRAIILERLKTIGPMLAKEIEAECGLGHEGTRKAINAMHAAGLIYVKDWPHLTVQRARLWALKTSRNQIDAPKPAKGTNAEYQATYRARHKRVLKARRSAVARTNPFADLIG